MPRHQRTNNGDHGDRDRQQLYFRNSRRVPSEGNPLTLSAFKFTNVSIISDSRHRSKEHCCCLSATNKYNISYHQSQCKKRRGVALPVNMVRLTTALPPSKLKTAPLMTLRQGLACLGRFPVKYRTLPNTSTSRSRKSRNSYS